MIKDARQRMRDNDIADKIMSLLRENQSGSQIWLNTVSLLLNLFEYKGKSRASK